jgi:hypothetical protein
MPFGVSDALKKNLELTDTQTRGIMQITREFSEWQGSRVVRQAQVRAEILFEEKKSPLDPMALGLRYAELESIRREVEEESNRVRRRIHALLTDAQKQKVAELERARALAPVIAEAECVNLLAPAQPDPIARLTGFGSSPLLGTSLNPMCFGGILPIIVPAFP